jgi:hypothetical protein
MKGAADYPSLDDEQPPFKVGRLIAPRMVSVGHPYERGNRLPLVW